MPSPPYREFPTIAVVRTMNELDPAGYLAANPDVKAAGLQPHEHFRRYGMQEGRRQFVNTAAIKKLRREKLKAVSFLHNRAEQPTISDEPLNFLSKHMKDSFEIPDAPPAAANEYNPELVNIIRSNPKSMFLDVGAGLRHTYYSNVVNTEIWSSASTDVVCVGEDLPFADAQFDHVFCLAVLEHTKRPWLAAQELVRVTKSGGIIRVDWPFLQPVHGYPHHFFNATPKGNRSQFEDQCEIISCEVRVWQHPIFALSWMLEEWQNGLPQEDKQAFWDIRIGDLIGDIPRRSHLAKQPFCAHLSKEAQNIIAAGTTLIARKR